MTNYVWKATDPAGKPVIREVRAQTAEESKFHLVEGGYTELELCEEEVMRATVEPMSRTRAFGIDIEITPAERIEASRKPLLNWTRLLLLGVWQSKEVLLTILVVAGALFYGRQNVWAWTAVGTAGAWLLYIVMIGIPAVYYNKLNRAVEWNRWEEVLEIVRVLALNNRISFIKIPEPELARNRAKAFAGLGRVEEGLEQYRQYEGQPGCPSWLFKAFVGGIYTTARQFDKAIEFTAASLQENERLSGYSDLAYLLARYKRDLVGARRALDKAEQGEHSEISRLFLLRARGVVLCLESRYVEARGALEALVSAIDRMPNVAFRIGQLSAAKAHLALVLARLGEIGPARKHFAEVEAYLRATQETDLLDEWESLLG